MPVNRAARDGRQAGATQCAFVNSIPRPASSSMFGVSAWGCPLRQPIQSLRSSIEMSRTLGGESAIAGPLCMTMAQNIARNRVEFFLGIWLVRERWKSSVSSSVFAAGTLSISTAGSWDNSYAKSFSNCLADDFRACELLKDVRSVQSLGTT